MSDVSSHTTSKRRDAVRLNTEEGLITVRTDVAWKALLVVVGIVSGTNLFTGNWFGALGDDYKSEIKAMVREEIVSDETTFTAEELQTRDLAVARAKEIDKTLEEHGRLMQSVIAAQGDMARTLNSIQAQLQGRPEPSVVGRQGPAE